MTTKRFPTFSVCAPGLETITAGELAKLGVAGNPTHGGVNASMTMAQLMAANLRLRTATRVLVRVARFPADGFITLGEGLAKIDWRPWLTEEAQVDVTVASSQSKLYHTGAVEERVLEAVGAGSVGPAQTISVRIIRDEVTVSIDSSGEALHKRGYRQATAKAPIRETLAAALILASEWDRRRPLLDPFCGSGTIPIEAALLARRMAPGRHRSFAFQRWPDYDVAAWTRVVAGADADVIDKMPTIIGSDRDEGAIVASQANAARAGVSPVFRQAALSGIVVPVPAGWMVTNPPYGERVAGGDLRDLYDRWATMINGGPFAAWRVALVAPHDALTRRLGALESLAKTTNGGIDVDILRKPMPDAS
jgi:putative N6-adenine-specific DNA methylase